MSLVSVLSSVFTRIGEECKDLRDSALAKDSTFSATGAAAGYWLNMVLDFNGGGSDKEPWMVSAKNAGGTLLRATWLNEAGALRTRSVNNEEALKMYGPSSSYTGVLIRLQDKWESTRTDIWAIDHLGRPRIGPDSDICANVWVGTTGDTIPSGLPDGTVIVFMPA